MNDETNSKDLKKSKWYSDTMIDLELKLNNKFNNTCNRLIFIESKDDDSVSIIYKVTDKIKLKNDFSEKLLEKIKEKNRILNCIIERKETKEIRVHIYERIKTESICE